MACLEQNYLRYLLRGRLPSFSLLAHRIYRGKRWYKGGGDNGGGLSVLRKRGSILEASPRTDGTYAFGKMIGSGHFARVYKARHVVTGKMVAIKCICRERLTGPLDERNLRREIEIMESLRHPRILRMRGTFSDASALYIVTDYASGGDLLERVMAHGKYREADGRRLATALLDAVAFLHAAGVAHRDIKPENILLSRRHPTDVLLTDFGLSSPVSRPESLTTCCGTLEYSAPEVLAMRPYDQRADNWSVGVVLYVVLSGRSPFSQTDDTLLVSQVMAGEYAFPVSNGWYGVSRAATGFVGSLLVVEPSERAAAADALEHEWIGGAATGD